MMLGAQLLRAFLLAIRLSDLLLAMMAFSGKFPPQLLCHALLALKGSSRSGPLIE